MTVRLVLFGRQGAGKGTQSVFLSQHYDAPHISTGDMLRQAVAQGTPVGLQAQLFLDEGKLVPSEIVTALVKERVSQSDIVSRGFLLDGFPRTVAQAEALTEFASVDTAIDLDVPEEVVLERISSRRVCISCQAIYSVAVPPQVDGVCDKCGAEVIQRPDDTPEAISRRLETYREQTQPTIDWFAARGLLIRVDGLGTPNEVFERIKAQIDKKIG